MVHKMKIPQALEMVSYFSYTLARRKTFTISCITFYLMYWTKLNIIVFNKPQKQ